MLHGDSQVMFYIQTSPTRGHRYMTFGCDGRYAVGVIPKECTLVCLYRLLENAGARNERTTKRTPAKY